MAVALTADCDCGTNTLLLPLAVGGAGGLLGPQHRQQFLSTFIHHSASCQTGALTPLPISCKLVTHSCPPPAPMGQHCTQPGHWGAYPQPAQQSCDTHCLFRTRGALRHRQGNGSGWRHPSCANGHAQARPVCANHMRGHHDDVLDFKRFRKRELMKTVLAVRYGLGG